MSKMRVEFITKKQLTVEFVKISNHNVSRILVGNSVSRNHLRGKAKNLDPKNSGPKNSGPKNLGPKILGPINSGPKNELTWESQNSKISHIYVFY